MPDQNPPEYTHGLAELIRSHRLYMGLSKDGMADRLGMSIRSYERIESGARDCPPGLLDHIETVSGEFDDAVGTLIGLATAEEGLYTVEKKLTVSFTSEFRHEWMRAVSGRAAVLSGLVMPILTDGTPRDTSWEKKRGIGVS